MTQEQAGSSAASDNDEIVLWICYQWPRRCGHYDDVDCLATEEAIKERLQTFEVPAGLAL